VIAPPLLLLLAIALVGGAAVSVQSGFDTRISSYFGASFPQNGVLLAFCSLSINKLSDTNSHLSP